jgi:uncharacterized secreted protein with C-terminal beta-propeller domain
MSDKLIKAFAEDNAHWIADYLSDEVNDKLSDMFNDDDSIPDYDDQVEASRLLMKEVIKLLEEKWK